MKRRLGKREMKRLALLKWEHLVEYPDHLYRIGEYLPELEGLLVHCSYCDEYHYKGCRGCPIKVGSLMCFNYSHPFNTFRENQTSTNAQVVLDIIRNVKTYERKPKKGE
jgi:hypothetical protein